MATVRVTTTFTSSTLIEVSDNFDPAYDDLRPEDFETPAIRVLRHHGILEQTGPRRIEYEYAA